MRRKPFSVTVFSQLNAPGVYFKLGMAWFESAVYLGRWKFQRSIRLLSFWAISSFLGGFEVFVVAFIRRLMKATTKTSKPPENDEIAQRDNRNQER